MSEPDGYILARTETEADRLALQGRILEPMTRKLFDQIGLGPGMNCLDLGCGTGACMELMAEYVGSEGRVTGIDSDAALGNVTLTRLRQKISTEIAFVHANLDEIPALPGGPYDLTFARLVLIHSADPIAMISKMKAATKSGGIVAVQDYNMSAVDIQPRPRHWDTFQKVYLGPPASGFGRDRRIGNKLPVHFVSAGLGPPDGTDVSSSLGPFKSSRGENTLRVIRSLVPAALDKGLVTNSEADQMLAELDGMMAGDQYFAYSSTQFVTVWKRIV